METARQMRVTSQRKAVRVSAAAHSRDGESVPLNNIVTPRSKHRKGSKECYLLTLFTTETVTMETPRQTRVTSQRKAVGISAAAHSRDGESVPLNNIVTLNTDARDNWKSISAN